MQEHPIQGLMNTAMENLKSMVDVNTIIGDPVHTPDGSVILTVSKVGFGFAAGGSEFMKQTDSRDRNALPQQDLPFGGGSGGGVSITPVAFLVVNSKDIKMIKLDGKTDIVEKVFDAAPGAFEKVSQIVSDFKKEPTGSIDQPIKFESDFEAH